MLHPSTKKLIDKLGEMTRRHRVAWIEGEDGTLVHDTEGYRVVLTPEPHGILLTDALGREIETCTPEEFADEKDVDGRPYPQFVGELFREAHRHARGTEKAIRTLLAGLEAAEKEDEAPPPAEAETATDETAQMDGEGAITAAVATLADQINTHVPVTPEAPAPAPEPQPEAPAEAAAPEPPPGPEPVAEAAPQPQPEPQPEPDPEPARPAPMQQRFSLSGIPYGVGALGTPVTAPPEPEKPAETAPPPPRTLVIDGTEDLPDTVPDLPEPSDILSVRREDENGGSDGIPPLPPRRFNPWN